MPCPRFSHTHTQPLLKHKPAIEPRRTLVSGFISVPEESVALIEYFGDCHTIAKPGLHYFASTFTTYFRVDLRTILVDTPQQVAITSDFQKLIIDGSFSYRITNPYNAVYKIQILENPLTFLYYQSILTHIAQITNNDAMSLDKSKFSKAIKVAINSQINGILDSYDNDDEPHIVREAIEKKSRADLELISLPSQKDNKDQSWGVIVENVAITNIAYSNTIIKAMNEQREAEYQKKILETQADANKRKMTIDAEASQQQMRLAAETEKIKTILEAEGKLIDVSKEAEAQAKKLEIETKIKLETAEAEAKSRIIVAEANAKSMIGQVYANNSELLRRELMGDVVTAMKDFYTSPNSKIIISGGGNNDNSNFITQLLAMQAMFNGNGPDLGSFTNPTLKPLEGRESNHK